MKTKFLYLFIFYSIFCSEKLFSQAPNWVWGKSGATAASELANDVEYSVAGDSVYVGGLFTSNIGAPWFLGSKGTGDAFFSKWHKNGTLGYSKVIGSNGATEVAEALAIDPAGNVYVAGRFTGTSDFDPNAGVFNLTSTAATQDVFIAKYTSAGNFLWAVKGGGTGTDNALGIKADATGVYVTGTYVSGSAPTFSSYLNATVASPFSAQGGNEIFCAKYSTAGIVQWVSSAGSANSDVGYEIAIDANNAYVIGDYLANLTVYNPAGGVIGNLTAQGATGDIAILAFNKTTGALGTGWAANTNISSNAVDRGRGIAVDATGLYVTGGVSNNASFKYPAPAITTTSSANEDFFIARLNPANGIFQWAKTEKGGALGTELGTSIKINSTGKLFVTGTFNVNIDFVFSGGPVVTTAGGYDVLLASYTTNGSFIYANRGGTAAGGSTNNDYGYGVAVDNLGDAYVGGDHGGGAVFSPLAALTSAAGSNLFLTKCGCGLNLTIPLAGSDQSVCATSTVLAANVITSGVGTWSVIGGGTAVVTTPGSPVSAVTSLSVGVNKLVWRVTGAGCTTLSDTVFIYRHALPTVPAAMPSMSVCNSPTVFAGTTPVVGTGTWSSFGVPPGTPTITNVNLFNSAVTVSVGVTNFSWTIGNGVCPTQTSTLSITNYTPSTISNAGSSMSVCNSPTVFAGNAPTAGTGTWTTFGVPPGTPTITNVNSATSNVTVAIGVTNFSWTIQNGVCPASTSTISITNYTPSTISNAGPSMSVCNSPTVFAGNVPAAGTGTWTMFGPGTSTIALPNSATSNVTVGIGVQSFSWTIQNGVCPASTSTLSITNYTPPTTSNAGVSMSVCSSPTVFAGNVPAIGTGTWTMFGPGTSTIASPNAANSAVTVGIGVQNFSWTISNGVCPVSTSTISITSYTNPVVSNAGPSMSVCSSPTVFAGNVPAAGTGTWILSSGTSTIASPNLATSAVTVGIGINTFSWTISNGVCPITTSTVSITNYANPTPANAGSSMSVCGSSTVFAGNTPAIGTGTWTMFGPGTSTIVSPNLATSGVTVGLGVQNFSWTIGNGVCPQSTSTISITSYTNPTVASAGSNTTICSTTYTMNGNTPAVGTGSWTLISGAGTITSPTSPTTGITGLGVGANVFRWTISNGVCPNSFANVTITRDDFPTASNAGASQTICANPGTATLAANTPVVGLGSWNVISGPGLVVTPSAPNSQVIALGLGSNVFEWQITNGVCPASTSTVEIYEDAVPTIANAGASQSICMVTSATLTGNVAAVGTGSWTLVSGSGLITSPSSPTTGLTALGLGVNVFQWTISNGVCPPSTSTVSVIRYISPTASNAGPSQTLCATTATMAGNTPVFGNGLWTLISGSGIITTPTSPTTGITGLGVGANVFQWAISNGNCPVSTSTVLLYRDNFPTTANAGPNQTICTPTATMAGNTAAVGTGSWTLISGSGTITTPTLETTGLTALGTGTNIFQWTISNGVCPPSTSTVAIIRDPNPTASNAGVNQTVCATTATMTGNVPAIGTGTWSLVSGLGTITSPNLANTGLTALGGGVNIFQWTIGNGVCPNSSSTVSITRDLNPSVASAGASQSVCASNPTVTMNGNVPVIGTGIWTLISGSGTITTPTLATTSITALGTGTNIFQWTISNGSCPPSTATVLIKVDAVPTLANAGPSQTICASTTATMAANTAAIGTGSWTLISGAATITTPTLETTGITALGAGVNVFQWTISNGACASTSSTMSITRDLNPTVANAGVNQTVCATAATLNGNIPAVGTGSWTLVSGTGTITSPTLPNSGLTNLGVGVNVFQWTISNGSCPPSSATVSIQHDANPTVASAGSNTTICATSYTMNGNTPAVGTGSWTLISGAGTITSPTSPTTGITGLGVGANVFRWTISNGVCPNSFANVTITRDNFPTVSNAGPSQSICVTAGAATLAANTPVVGVGSWNVISGPGIVVSPTSPNSQVLTLGIGSNVFEWQITNGVCPASTSTVDIQVDNVPTVSNAGVSQSICATSSIVLNGNLPAVGTGSWTLVGGSGIITSATLPTTTVTALGVGVDIFQWTISNGACPPSSSTVSVTRYLNPTIANAGPSQSVCANTATMAANTPAIGTGSWTLISGAGTILSPASPSTALTALGTSTSVSNIFQWTISNGVCPPSTSTVLIDADAVPTIANAGLNQTICTPTATMAGNTPAVGTGSWTLISGLGTITTPTLETTGLTALGTGTNIFQWTISNGVCPPSISTVAIIRDPNPTVSNAGVNQTVCATTATMTGNVPAIGTGTWSLVSGVGTITSPNLANTGLTALGFGANVFQWTIGNGVCPNSSSTVSITRDQNPTVSSAGASQTVCASNPTVTMNGNAPAIGTGSWTLISGAGTIVTPTLATTTVTAIGTGTNIFQWTISNGVCPSSSSTVLIQGDAIPSVANAGVNQTVCATTATLNGNIPAIGTGTWSLVLGIGTITSPLANNTGLTALGVGVNVFQWTIGNGVCANSSSTVSVQRDANPSISVAGPNQTVCATTANLNGNVPAIGTGTWSLVSGAGVPTTPTLATTNATSLGAGVNIFQWVIGNGVCPNSTSTVSIQQDLNPTTSTAGVSQTVCATTATMTGNVPAIGTGTWSLVSGVGTITSPNLANTGLTALGFGANIFQWTIGNGVCPNSSSTVSITRDQNPTVSSAGASQTVCASNPTVTMNGNVPAIGTGSWTLISGSGTIVTPTLATTTVTAIGTGTNIFQWTISNGVCPSSSSTVLIQGDAIPSVANAGVNQTVCATTATLNGNIPAIGTGTWSLVSGIGTITSPLANNTGLTALGVGVNVFQWTIGNGVCANSSSTVSVQRDANPSISVAGSNQTVCATTANLNGNVPAIGTGTWSLVSGGGVPTTPTLATTNATSLGAGVNIFQWVIGNGVCPNSTSTVSIQQDLNPTTSTAGVSQTVCATTATMTGNIPAIGTGTWSLVSGIGTITSPLANNTGLTALGVGVNVFQWTIGNGVCPNSSSTVSIQRDANPSISAAGPNQTVCATTANLNGNVPAIGTGTWSCIFGTGVPVTPLLAATSATGLSVGPNIFQWTIGNGVCPNSTSTVSVQRDEVPTTATAGVNQTVCATTATLNGNIPTVGTGTWSLVSGSGAITFPLVNNTGLTALGVGVNIFQWTIGNGVCPNSTSTVSVQRDDNPTLAAAGPNQTVCALTATMAGNIPAIGTGTWSLVSGAGNITAPLVNNTGLTSLGVGPNIFKWVIGNGVCPNSTSTVSITRDDFPTASSAGVSMSICATSTVLAGNVPSVGTGTWSLISGSGVVTTPTLATSSVTALGVGVNVFQWTIGNGVCANSTSTIAITRYANPSTASAGPNQTICAAATILAANTPTIGNGFWTLLSGAGNITTPTATNSGVTALGIGTNVFQWTIANGVCPVSIATVAIQQDAMPSPANAGASQTLCVNYGTLTAVAPVIGTGNWSVLAGGSTIITPTNAITSVTNIALGNNTYQWVVSNGVCPNSTATVSILGLVNLTVSAGLPVFNCGYTATLGGMTPVVGTTTWIPLSGPNVNSVNNPTSTISFTSAGTYTYILEVGFLNCPIEDDTVSVTIYDMPSISNAGSNQTICANTATVSANTPTIGTGVWNLVSGGGAVVSPSVNVSSVNSLPVGVNVFEWVISNGTCPPSTSTVSIQVDDNPADPIAGADQTICLSSSTLNATPPPIGNGVWNVINGGSSVTTPTLNNSSVNSLTIGVNTLEWIVTNGVCPSKSDTMQIMVDANPTNALAGADQFTCSMNAFLSGNIPTIGTGTWIPQTTEPSVNSPFSPTTAVSFTNQGVYTYIWSVGNGVCPVSTDTVVINTFLSPSIPDAGLDQVNCATVATITANTPAIGSGTWTALNGATSLGSIVSPTTNVTLPGQGNFSFVWEVGNSVYCPVLRDTVYVRSYLNPTAANAGMDVTSDCLMDNMSANLAAVGVGSWSVLQGSGTFGDVTNPNTQYFSNVDGLTKLAWSISNGNCPVSVDTVELYINPILIPQIVTPNNDGNNDYFEIKAINCLSGVKINIFNRWGNLVYESADYKNDFKGLNNAGEMLADDTYYYLIDVNNKTYKGYFVIRTN